MMRCLYDGVHPCGRCPACMANRQRAFMFRLDQEKDNCSFYYWLTLQYSDECVPRYEDGEMCFSKEHCRKFFEKIRHRYEDKGFTFKHFLVSEYGPNSTHRPHYHCLLMVYTGQTPANDYLSRREMKDFILEKAWPHGHVTEKSYHGRVLRYLTKYCMKPEMLGQYHKMKPFTLISKGIGLSYLNNLPKMQIDQMISTLDFTVRYGDKKIQLPRYYVDKLFPHGKQDLFNLIPDDPSGDWSSYLEMYERRQRMSANQRKIQTKSFRSKSSDRERLGDSEYFSQIDRVRETSWNNFRSKVKQRKDL